MKTVVAELTSVSVSIVVYTSTTNNWHITSTVYHSLLLHARKLKNHVNKLKINYPYKVIFKL